MVGYLFGKHCQHRQCLSHDFLIFLKSWLYVLYWHIPFHFFQFNHVCKKMVINKNHKKWSNKVYMLAWKVGILMWGFAGLGCVNNSSICVILFHQSPINFSTWPHFSWNMLDTGNLKNKDYDRCIFVMTVFVTNKHLITVTHKCEKQLNKYQIEMKKDQQL